MEGKRLFDRKEVAAILGMEVRQFRASVSKGLLPVGKRRGGRDIWSQEDIEVMLWLEMNRDRFQVKVPKTLTEQPK